MAVRKALPAYQQVADQLRELITDGRLTPGDRLPSEAELATTYGVSRSTVREALRALSSRDLLTTTRGTTGGTFVARVQSSQVSDYLETSIEMLTGDGMTVQQILEAREILEVPAARLAAQRRSDEHLQQLAEALANEDASRTGGLKFREHKQFHAIVVAAAGNVLLDVVTQPVFRVLQGRYLQPDLGTEFWANVEHDHVEIAQLISASDADGAERAMREHLQRLRGAYSSR